ncbi:MAG TPA: clostripain-related cysteine peptidase, partial [Stenomitos sp.]
FAEYLNWARSQFQAKKWVIVFLGHGGRLDEISPDEHPIPGVSSATQWINIQKLSNILANFNHQVDNRVELFFFQNCNKGTIEVNYTFRNTAKYTLSSQLQLGAPNSYYEPLLQFIGRNPEIDGGQLASKIMEFEAKDMYQSYTAVNNRAFDELPTKINPVIELILSSNIKTIKLSELKTYTYMGDRFVDLVAFFQAITKQVGIEPKKYQKFLEFFNNSLIYRVQKTGTMLGSSTQYQNLSGLGMLFPRSRSELEKYRYLQVFSDLKLVKLFDAILLN